MIGVVLLAALAFLVVHSLPVWQLLGKIFWHGVFHDGQRTTGKMDRRAPKR